MYNWSNVVENIVDSAKFRLFILGIICINTIFLASEFYSQPDWWTDVLLYGNYIFTVLFTIEMMFKLFGFGVKGYLNDYWNIFDGIIVFMSLLELCLQGEKSMFQVLRAFRLARLFRIIKSWKKLRILLSTVLKSLSAIANLGFLTLLFMFICALLGKNFFADPNSSRYNFNSTG